MAVDSDRLHEMFRSDCVQMTQVVQQSLEKIAAGDTDIDLINSAFRAVHSLKSEAAFLRLHDISTAAHALEEQLATLRGRDSAASHVVVSSLEVQMALLTSAVDRYSSAPGPQLAADSELGTPSESETAPSGEGSSKAAQAEAVRLAHMRGEQLFRVSVRLTCEPAFAYPRAFLVLTNLELVSAVIQCKPAVTGGKDDATDMLEFVVATSDGRGVLENAVNVDEVELVSCIGLSFGDLAFSGPEQTMSPLLTDSQEVELYIDELAFAAAQLKDIDPSDDQAQENAGHLCERIQLLSDVALERMGQGGTVQLLGVLNDLQPRVVAYAAELGKRVKVEVSGSGVLVHGAISDTLVDAVLHVVRNSIYHGIDSAVQRASIGKPPAGRIRIEVLETAGRVIVEVSDDGVGIDEESIRRRIGDQERTLLDVITAPGFTTKDGADRTSGRGVGLDAVVHSVRDLLGGDVELETSRGVGVRIRMTIPAKSRVVRVIVADSADGVVAIPEAVVVESHKLDLRRVRRDSFGIYYYEHRGETVPMVTPFGSTPDEESFANGEDLHAIIARLGRFRTVIVVDEAIAEETIVRSNRRLVYSKSVGRELPFVFPAHLPGTG